MSLMVFTKEKSVVGIWTIIIKSHRILPQKKKKNHRSERKAAREEGKNFGLQDSPKKQLPKWQ